MAGKERQQLGKKSGPKEEQSADKLHIQEKVQSLCCWSTQEDNTDGQTCSDQDHQQEQRECPLWNSDQFLLDMYTTAGCPCLPLSNTNSFNLNYCCRREQDTKQNPAHAFFSSYLIKNMVHSLCYISHFYIRWCS